MAVARPVVRLSTANVNVFLVGRWCLNQLSVTGERHNADLRAGLLVLDEVQRGFLCGPQARGRDVVLTHTTRHVERQDNSRLASWHGDDIHRAGQGQDQAGQSNKKESEQANAASTGKTGGPPGARG